MSFSWMRRAALALASVSLLTLAACGSGSIVSQLEASRVFAFGDGLSDIGQTGTKYTVNDGNTNIWTQGIAAAYGAPAVAANAGGTFYAQKNARVVATPDAAGSTATPTIKQQIDAYITANRFGERDLVIINGGTSDIIAEMALVTSGAQTGDQMLVNVRQAGRDLAAQVRRLVQAGSTHVVVSGVYDLARTPWGQTGSNATLLADASARFNEELLINIVDLGNSVLYVDTAFLFNLMTAVPTAYGMTNSIAAVCTSIDPGPGIGIGAGEINSGLCTPSTTLANVSYEAYLFADKVYPTPQGHRKFGEYAFSRIRARW
ncbi:SGNH/GDSL hydrolase family protein [Caenimonas sp. SL110]|uniref:SGNH/GDSL hydrolase family protein n=1 Tax=Caenimonas sp. SL110 TaxID=1450524 RepID=UPI000652A3BA|nr:SGNH/GDSL hydrolase family protein [Caenimonas sp. SL110]